MAIPEKVIEAWDNKSGPAIFTTVDKSGNPNSVYVTCLSRYDNSTFIIADNYFEKTRQNIFAGSRASLLFITGKGESLQLKGSVELFSSGEYFDDMKKWNPEKHPGRAAAVLTVDEAFAGSEKLL